MIHTDEAWVTETCRHGYAGAEHCWATDHVALECLALEAVAKRLYTNYPDKTPEQAFVSAFFYGYELGCKGGL